MQKTMNTYPCNTTTINNNITGTRYDLMLQIGQVGLLKVCQHWIICYMD